MSTPASTSDAASRASAASVAVGVRPWVLVLCAAALMAVSNGSRQSLGLFVSPLNTSTGMGLAAISFALAVGQLMWGLVQPFAGAIADRQGTRPVVVGGLLLLALGTALTSLVSDAFALSVVLGVVAAAGAGAASFSVMLGAVAQKLPPEKRGPAAGVINAGGSFGQFVFAPITQGLIGLLGWVSALWALAGMMLAALPLTGALPRRAPPPPAPPAPGTAAAAAPQDRGVRHAVATALRDRSYLLLAAGFFTCGFHIAFLVTHLPGEVQLCGLPVQVASWSLAIIGLSNIGGSLFAGWWTNRMRSKYILFWMYFSRAVLVVIYLLAPKVPETFYLFAVGLGFTWLATVPPTAGVIGKLFGPRYMATLFGIALVSHQVGGFLGAWLGGIAMEQTGNYTWMWYADALLALAAALVNLPIQESRPQRTVVPAAS